SSDSPPCKHTTYSMYESQPPIPINVLDQTPLLDIKPYVSKFDVINDSKSGWLENVMHKSEEQKSDRRFE
ncbi:MAG: hypothetical protein ACNYWU_06010, partial [Desulfobacterales bacterium]